ncbi:ankyrin repeat-containing domain protein [Mycena vulgaris]|nr:ankyrin repeat-containing domain protein [Mycena vulgaris]
MVDRTASIFDFGGFYSYPLSLFLLMAEALGTVANIIQLVDTALKAREYLKDFRDAPKEQQKLLVEMEGLMPLLAELLKRLVENPSSETFQQMTAPLTIFETTMKEFTKKLGPRDEMSKFTRKITWALWSKKEAGGYLEELERIKALINIWLTMGIWNLSLKQMSNQADILLSVKDAAQQQREHISAEKRQAIFDWISPLEFLQRQVDVFSTLQPGTGEWLLADAQFQDWESGSGKTLWCPGMPGAGKTVLASLVFNHLEVQARKDGIGLACIYLNHKETQTQTLVNLLGALWKQLMLGKSIPLAVDTLYDYHYERKTRPHLDEFRKALNLAITQYPKVYFILDALDEYPEDIRHPFIQYLATLGPKVNIMMTSRPHIGLDSIIPEFQILEIRATDDDIYRYLSTQIEQSPRLSRHIKARPDLQEDIQSKIVANCKGMFLLAKLHIESLASKNTIKAVREALQHLPTDLQQTYDEAIGRIKRQREEDRELGLLALTWVANAKRPLSVSELQEALAIEEDSTFLDVDNLLDISMILSVCAGLIIVDETLSVVRLIHYTAQGYLDNIQSDQFPLAQTKIVFTCLTYLSLKEFENLPQSEDEEMDLISNHPFLEYAQYCLLHAKGQPELELQNKIIFFLTVEARRWKDSHIWRWGVAPWDYDAGFGEETDYFGSLWIAATCNLETIASDLLNQAKIATEAKDQALYAASYRGHGQTVQLLTDNGADVNAQGGYFGNALQAASSSGNELVVQLLIDKGADVNTQGGHYGNALQAASLNEHQLVVQLLLDNDADVNVQGGYFGNALQAASLNEHQLVVQLLLDNEADVNVQGGYFGNALQAASFNGHEIMVQLLIDKGADVNAQGGHYGNALQAASYRGHERVVQLLLDKGADVNAQGGYLGNALQAASFHGHEIIVQLLINKGADVNVQGGYFGNALQAASVDGHELVVQLLIDKGADVNAQGGENGNALQAASCRGHELVVQLLIDKGADVNVQGGHFFGNALQAASINGHELVVQLLINKGADVNAQGGYSGNALQAALLNCHELVVQLLIDKGADVNAHSGHYGNALQAASFQGQEQVVQFLIDKGADVNAQGGRSGNALQAASFNGHELVVQLLINNGADVNSKGENYGNALQAASSSGNEQVVQLLVNKGADVNAQGGYLGNALQAASFLGHEIIVQLLINKGADVNAQGGDFGNALQAASFNGHELVVQLLIDKGADVNVQGGYFGNALQAASVEGHELVVQLLIDKGADVNTQGGHYGNALQAASLSGNKLVAQLLINKGADNSLLPGIELVN